MWNWANWLNEKCKIGLGDKYMQSTHLRFENKSRLKSEMNDKLLTLKYVREYTFFSKNHESQHMGELPSLDLRSQ